MRLAAAVVGALILATSGYLAGTRLRSEDRTPAGPLKAEEPADSCVAPYVWRLAVPSDHVCVTKESRNRVELENQRAPERRAGGGRYGPDSCLTGYVWREAFDGDTVCVLPDRRDEVRRKIRWHLNGSNDRFLVSACVANHESRPIGTRDHGAART